ncbi:MAG: HupE/UreJ family protein [Zoogloeaceae bacterium]|nr:HupE/UreJ family protein [Zoogloeaceae bacterium]
MVSFEFAQRLRLLLPLALWLGARSPAWAHGVAEGDARFIEQASGAQWGPFVYLGAKHMATGYDHLLFLFGVLFFIYRMKDVAVYVTLFAVGHSATLLYGVLSGTHVDAYLVDALIGLSVVYKALDNLGAYKVWFGIQPNPKAAVLTFGLFHGLGLATKLQDFRLPADGLVTNILAFNVGVEIGQILALGAILIAMDAWRRDHAFARQAFASNVLLMAAGFALIGYQLTGFMLKS